MASKKISQLTPVTPLLTDLVPLDRPTTGAGAPVTGHATLAAIGAVIGGGGGGGNEYWFEKGLDNIHTTGSAEITGSLSQGSGAQASGPYSHAEGLDTTATGNYSHAEGDITTASGYCSHAEGASTTASGDGSHAEGFNTTASGNYSHAEGDSTTASGNYSHAEGDSTTASGYVSHAEGYLTIASGSYTHAEGFTTTASGSYSHAEGSGTYAIAEYSHVEGNETVSGWLGFAIGFEGTDIAPNSVVYSFNSRYGDISEFLNNNFSNFVVSYPDNTVDNLSKNFPLNFAFSSASYDSGKTYITGILDQDPYWLPLDYFAVLTVTPQGGQGITIVNLIDLGADIWIGGTSQHAEGSGTTAVGEASHAEGESTTASGDYSHAEGTNTTASGYASHTEGGGTTASGDYSHAEGYFTTASGSYSHAEGSGTIASGSFQHVQGKYNQRNNNFSLFVIGDGTGDSNANRSDIVRVNSGSSPGTGRLEVTGSLGVTIGMTGSLSYTPASGSHWSDPDPTNVKDALDRMAALLYTLNSNTPIP